jgi:hypothetical protein
MNTLMKLNLEAEKIARNSMKFAFEKEKLKIITS